MLEKSSSNEMYAQDRELSWLKFNSRVLEEAGDQSVPLLERLKFISIFTSNLDEFFMIRVGGLFDLFNVNPNNTDVKTGLTPAMQLELIYEAIKPMYIKKDVIFNQLQSQLKEYSLYDFKYSELTTNERNRVQYYYMKTVKPYLKKQVLRTYDEFPHLENNELYIVATLIKGNTKLFGITKIPENIPRLFFISPENSHFMRMENILLQFLEDIFFDYSIYDKTIIRVTRNADLDLNNEEDIDITDDIREQMKSLLEERTKLEPVRLELVSSKTDEIKLYLQTVLELDDEQVYRCESPMTLDYVSLLFARLDDFDLKNLLYPPFSPRICGQVDIEEEIAPQIKKRDLLLSFPFESMEPFLKLIKESSVDQAVVAIKITIYRLAEKTKLVEYLCEAAKNGKEVTVIIELLARFDEQNNIEWSEQLEKSGCTVIYGFKGFKVHSKICLITRLETEQGEKVVRYITQIGTGNFNEQTAQLYTDLSLLTYNQSIGIDTVEFFRNMENGTLFGELNGRYEHLVVAPTSFKERVLDLIESEIAFAHIGRIFIKVNSLTDIDIIEKLREASQAGVQVSLVVRGICCILPGVVGKTDNIHVTSIVGRFLEHSRIYSFGSGNLQKIYISSADLMTRNTTQRIEVACPILDEYVKRKINYLINIVQMDNVKSRVLLPTGEYTEKADSIQKLDSQEIMMRDASYFEANMSYYRKKQKYKKRIVRLVDHVKDTLRRFKVLYSKGTSKDKTPSE